MVHEMMKINAILAIMIFSNNKHPMNIKFEAWNSGSHWILKKKNRK